MTAQSGSAAKKTESLETPDFSLVMGGPLFQIFRRTHLSGSGLELLFRRIAVISLLAWLPMLLLSVMDGQSIGGPVRIPFLYDIEAHARFLIALPVLIAAEVIVHRRLSPLMRRFVERRIVEGEDLPRLYAAVNSTMRVRNSVTPEVILIVLVYTAGIWLWRSHVALEEPTWYATTEATHLHLTLAGHWYAFVSIPIFQFILLRWYMRLVLWFGLLWRISRLNLHLNPYHPDHAGGIGFLGKSSYAFGPFLFAQGTLLSGLIASRVLYEGQGVLSFKMEAAGLVGLFLLFILGPLVMFTPQLLQAKRRGTSQFGMLATDYVFAFQEKWLRGGIPETGQLLGTADIQSLADMANNYSAVSNMRIIPFGVRDITQLAAATAAPLLPLTLTVFSLEELLTRVLKILI